jgi:hypothetical protein
MPLIQVNSSKASSTQPRRTPGPPRRVNSSRQATPNGISYVCLPVRAAFPALPCVSQKPHQDGTRSLRLYTVCTAHRW